jgi:hypothetical protein
LVRAPRPPIDEVRRIVREIADALEYAHDAAWCTATSSPTTFCSTPTAGARW